MAQMRYLDAAGVPPAVIASKTFTSSKAANEYCSIPIADLKAWKLTQPNPQYARRVSGRAIDFASRLINPITIDPNMTMDMYFEIMQTVTHAKVLTLLDLVRLFLPF